MASQQNSLSYEFIKGIWKENPNLVALLGMCPTLAITTSLQNAVGMSLAVAFCLLCSEVFIAALRNLIPTQVRMAAFIVIIAAFVTISDLYLRAFQPSLSKSLGPFVPLIVVNCIIMGRVEAFSSKNGVIRSILDSLGMSVGYGLVLFVISGIRELIGNGTLMGYRVMGSWWDNWLVMILPAGAFLTLGSLLGLAQFMQSKLKIS